VFGYGAKQVRDNIHAADLIAAFAAFHRAPRAGAVYTSAGAGRATARCSRRSTSARRSLVASCQWSLGAENRVGDHRWWISDLEPFKRDYPDWDITHDVRDILREIHDSGAERWGSRAREAVRRDPGPRRGRVDPRDRRGGGARS